MFRFNLGFSLISESDRVSKELNINDIDIFEQFKSQKIYKRE